MVLLQHFEASFFMAMSLCILIAAGAFWKAYRRRQGGQSWVEAIRSLIRPTGLAMSVAAVFAFTIYMPRFGEVWQSWLEGGVRLQPAAAFNGNLVPFRTISSYLASTPSLNVAVQLLGNVLLFVPLGFFLAYGSVFRTAKALTVGLFVAVLVEAWQSLVGRTFDIDDVILNGIGVVLGVSVAVLFFGIGKSAIARKSSPDPGI